MERERRGEGEVLIIRYKKRLSIFESLFLWDK